MWNFAYTQKRIISAFVKAEGKITFLVDFNFNLTKHSQKKRHCRVSGTPLLRQFYSAIHSPNEVDFIIRGTN